MVELQTNLYFVLDSEGSSSCFFDASWLVDLGFMDSPGSTVVQSIGAWVALAGIIINWKVY